MRLFFKIKTGYAKEDFVRVTTPQDLEKAFGLFASKEDGYIAGQPVRGVDIITVVEDWNKALGVSDDYKLNGEDHSILARDGIKAKYAGVIEKYKKRVEYLAKNGQAHLIGQKVPIPELDAPESREISDGAKRLSDKMKMPM